MKIKTLLFNSAGTTEYPYAENKQTKFNPYLAPYPQINSQQIIDLNAKPKTIKFPEENLGENLCKSGLGKDC